MTSKKWKKYEIKVYEAVKRLSPKDKIEHNIKVTGSLSKSRRQIDVSKNRDLPNDFLIYECKDHKRRLDTPKVEELYTKLKDVGAIKGAIVSNSSFTAGAVNMAKELGISLYALVDTKDKDILPKLFATVFIEDTYLKSFSISLTSSDPKAIQIIQTSPSEICFKNSRGNFFSAYNVISKLWNEGKDLIQKPGFYAYHPIKITGDVGIWANKRDEPIIVRGVAFNYEVAKRNHLSRVEIIEANGLFNVHEGSFQAHGTLTTAPITPYEIQTDSEPTDLTLKEAQATFKFAITSVMPKNPRKEIVK